MLLSLRNIRRLNCYLHSYLLSIVRSSYRRHSNREINCLVIIEENFHESGCQDVPVHGLAADGDCRKLNCTDWQCGICDCRYNLKILQLPYSVRQSLRQIKPKKVLSTGSVLWGQFYKCFFMRVSSYFVNYCISLDRHSISLSTHAVVKES